MPSSHTLFLLSSSLGSLWHCCKGGAAALGPQSREWKASRTPVCPLLRVLSPVPLLGLGVLLPLPTYLYRAPQGRTHTNKCTAQSEVKQSSLFLYSGSWKLQCESEKDVTEAAALLVCPGSQEGSEDRA